MLVSELEKRFQKEMLSREARAEKFACVLWIVVIVITYSFFLLETSFQPALRSAISYLVFLTVPGFLLLYLYMQIRPYHPAVAYLNSILQLSVVSGAIYFDTQAYGAQYALSSMPPIAYGLVIIVTAFRLRPMMGLFAGGLAASQFLFIYAFISRAASDMTPQILEQIPSLDWEVTIMKAIVLIGIGSASSFSAFSLRRELHNFIASAQQEMRLHQGLGRYVSSDIADAIRESDSQVLATRKVEVTVMFGDIRNFTEFSNTRSPEEVARTLNNFFDKTEAAISAHGGVLNKFMGDGFLAIFGLFDTEANSRTSAVNAAFEILESTNETLLEKGLGAGMALNHGAVIAGEIGAKGRCEYTVIGNTVNISARLEGLNSQFQTKLLVTSEFYKALPVDMVETNFHGKHTIRGIAEPIELIELLALKHKQETQ
ncbi:MAG: adenylate/guanylate cyclase domain-containing protein [Pseudohongiellaceae bacterium]